MTQRTTLAIVLATLLVAAAAVPAAVTAQTAESTLTVDVTQDADGDVTVTVSDNGTAVENATVSVDPVDENASYAGEGAYQTDANGTVDLPAPDDPVSVVVTAVDGDETASITADLEVPSLDIAVEQAADGAATMTVTHGITGEPVEDADVDVDTVDADADYDGVGDYDTDENGTVVLPAPEETVEVWVNASSGDLDGATTAELQTASLDVGVEQDEDAEATVTVTYSITGAPVDDADLTVSTVNENATYAGTGDHETDENGTVELPAPDETVEVQLVATSGNLSGSTTVTLENASSVDENESAFGQRVSAFVHDLLNGDEHERRIGLLIAEWVTANNPGNAPDHAGPPEDVGPDDDDESEEDAEHDDRERGPPDHAAADDAGDDQETEDEAEQEGDDDDSDQDDDEDEEDADDDDDRGGPPEHAGSNSRGNGR